MALGFVAASSQWVNSNWQPTIGLTQKWSLSCWFWWNNGAGTNGCVFGGYGGVGNQPVIELMLEGTGSKFYLAYKDDGAAGVNWALSSLTVSKNAWHHLAFVRNITADKLDLYVDAVLYHNVADTTTQALTFGKGLGIGARNANGVPQNLLTGAVDDLAIWWGVELTTAQIASLYNSKRRIAPRIQPGSLLRWWPLQGPNGVAASGALSVQDCSVNLGHGTPAGSPLYALSTLSWPAPRRVIHATTTAGAPMVRRSKGIITPASVGVPMIGGAAG